MIRPITCVSFLLACSSGLYLYQTKHRVRQLDAQIEAVAHQAEQVREQSRVLRAEWTLLDQPDRLQTLATQFLPSLQPTKPNQFVSANELDSRLPPVGQPPSESAPAATSLPIASDAAQSGSAALAAGRGNSDGAGAGTAAPVVATPPAAQAVAYRPPAPHVPQRPLDTPHQTESARSAEKQPVSEAARAAPRAAVPRRQVAMARPVPAESRPAVRTRAERSVQTVALPHPLPRYPGEPIVPAAMTPRYQAAGPTSPAYGGSLLGMAHGMAPPPPAPVWTNWNR